MMWRNQNYRDAFSSEELTKVIRQLHRFSGFVDKETIYRSLPDLTPFKIDVCLDELDRCGILFEKQGDEKNAPPKYAIRQILMRY